MGGTGSGTTDLVLQKLTNLFPKNFTICYEVVPPPSTIGQDSVSVYNNMLSLYGKETCTMEILVDNEALYRVCESHLGIESPSFPDINKLVADHASSLTSGSRFGGAKGSSFVDLCGNLMAYPRIRHFFPAMPPPRREDGDLADQVLETFDKANHLLTLPSKR